jgi:poly(A) polymerase
MIHSHALEIVQKLVRHGYIAYFAGGWVRDFVMGRISDDIDIATNAPTDVILDLFPRTLLVGIQFGVVIVLVDGHQYEVSTFRKDISYTNGRTPERIEPSHPKEDAIRRDFTINGMFYDPLEEKLHDYVGGLKDIERRLIVTIGDPFERFFEDRLRLVRAFRFAARFQFNIDLETQEAIRQTAGLLFPAVAIERVWKEFCKMNAYPHFDHALVEMHRLGLLPIIFPDLEKVHLKDIEARVRPIAHYPENSPPSFVLQELFPDFKEDDFLRLGKYLKMSNKEIEILNFYIAHRLFELRGRYESSKFYAHPDSEICLQVYAARLPVDEKKEFFNKHQAWRKELEWHILKIQEKKTVLTSYDLMKAGVEKGKQMGLLLKEGEKIAIEQDIREPDAVILQLKKKNLWPN